MKGQKKWMWIVLPLGFAGILYLVTGEVLGVLIGFGIGLLSPLLLSLLLQKKEKEAGEAIMKDIAEEEFVDPDPKPIFKTEAVLQEELIEFNIGLRRNVFVEDVVVSIEAVADLLVKVLPDLNQNYPTQRATAALNQMFEDYIPEQAGKIADLTAEQQESSKDVFVELFQELLEKVQQSKLLLDEDKEEEAEAMALYLSTKLQKL